VKKIVLLVLLLSLFSVGTVHAVCQPGGICNGSNHLSWTAPTTNTDGSALTDFGGFVVVKGPVANVCAATSGTTNIDLGNLGVPATPLPNTTVPALLSSLALSQGLNFVLVKAYDTAANSSGCSSEISFTYDSIPPDTTITVGLSGTVTNGNASFSFTANEPATFECKLDAGSFLPCTTPKAYTGLVSGSHTFSVRAIDLALNVDATPATNTWSVSLAPPSPPSGITVTQ